MRVAGGVRVLLALAAALALLASQAVSALHFAFVPHHLCGLHGTLEDGAASVGVAHDSAEPKSPSASPADARGDAHEACVVATLGRQTATVQPAAASVSVAVRDSVLALVGQGADLKPDRASLLRCAPKQSPPAIA